MLAAVQCGCDLKIFIHQLTTAVDLCDAGHTDSFRTAVLLLLTEPAELKTINACDNDSVTSQARHDLVWMQSRIAALGRCVSRRLHKISSDGADVTCCGRLLQTVAAVTEGARSPMDDIRERTTYKWAYSAKKIVQKL